MKDMGIVCGSATQAVPLVIGTDTVYVHTDIEKIEASKDGKNVKNLFRYHEIQYDKDEYIQLMANRITDTQLALCEIYEGMM